MYIQQSGFCECIYVDRMRQSNYLNLFEAVEICNKDATLADLRANV